MTIPAAKARLLEDIVSALAEVPCLEAVALGGSHARGMASPSSDLDIGLYYRERAPFPVERVREIATEFSASGKPVVTDFYAWGPFVNGGAWIDNPVCKIDLLYRNLDQLERSLRASEFGRWEHDFDQQPPFGFRSVVLLGEVSCCKPLFDSQGILAGLKAAVVVYPPKLKERIIHDTLWGAEFSLRSALEFARDGDVPNAIGCMTRIFHYLVHALYALNEIYFVNDKRALQEIETFAHKPSDFAGRISAILASPGVRPDALRASLEALKALFDEIVALSNGGYAPRFALPPVHWD